MVQIKCELCGSNDFVKQDEYFVCQHCGCKYTVEQARKMSIEGVVNVEGEVKIDTTEKLKNLYVIARRSKENNDWDAAKRYYDLVLQEDPMSWEALFYLAYFDAYYCKNGELQYKAEKLRNCIDNVVELIGTSQMSLKEKNDAFHMIANSVAIIADSLISRAKSFKNSMILIKAHSLVSLVGAGKDVQKYVDTVTPMINCKFHFADGIEKVINQFSEYPELKKVMANLWLSGLKDTQELFGNRMNDHNNQIMKHYLGKINTYVPELSKEELEQFVKKGDTSDNTNSPSRLGKIFGLIAFIVGIVCFVCNLLVFSIIADSYYIEEATIGGVIMIGIYAIIPVVFGIISLKKGTDKKPFSIVGIATGGVAILFAILSIISVVA